MLSNAERNLLIKTYKEIPDAKKAAKIYSVSSNSVYRLVRRMKETGSVELKTGSRGRKPSLTPENIEDIKRVMEEQPNVINLNRLWNGHRNGKRNEKRGQSGVRDG